jgi:hypothetical protein
VWRTHILGQPIAELVAAQEAADARGEGFVARVGETAEGDQPAAPVPEESAEAVGEEPGAEPVADEPVAEGPVADEPVPVTGPRPATGDGAPGTRVVREP